MSAQSHRKLPPPLVALLLLLGSSFARADASLEKEVAEEQALASFAEVGRWHGTVRSTRGYLVYRLDELRLFRDGVIRLEEPPVSYAFLIHGCPSRAQGEQCKDVALWMVDPSTGRFQKGGVAHPFQQDVPALRLHRDHAALQLQGEGLAPAGPPLLVELLDARFFWFFPAAGGGFDILDAATGERLWEESFVDLIGEEVRQAHESDGGQSPPIPYPDEPFPSLRSVTEEQEMQQWQFLGTSELNLCGPTSLAMVSDFHGEHLDKLTVAEVSTDINARTHQRDLARAVAYSWTSTPRWTRTPDAPGNDHGYTARQEGGPTWHYGWVSCVGDYLAVGYDALAAYTSLIEQGQPPIVHVRRQVVCPSASPERSPAACTDTVDNDDDFLDPGTPDLVDCADPDCDPATCPNNSESTVTLCQGGGDDDGDGLVDCADPSCQVDSCRGNYTYTGGHYVVVIGVHQPAGGGSPLIVTLDPAENLAFWIRSWDAEEERCPGTPAVFSPGFKDYADGGIYRRTNGALVARPMPVSLDIVELAGPPRFRIEAAVRTYPFRSDVRGWAECNLGRPIIGCLLETTDHLCGNGVDDDGDTFTDCASPGCAHNPQVTVCGNPENSDAECQDGLDNDGDGATDCGDAGCGANYFVTVCGGLNLPLVAPATRERGDALCSNGLDDDGDGLADCADHDCYNPFTIVCGPFCDQPWWSGGGTGSVKVTLYRNGQPTGTVNEINFNPDPFMIHGTVSWEIPRDGSEIGDIFKVVAVGSLYGAETPGYPQAERLWFDQVYGWSAIRMDGRKMQVKVETPGGQQTVAAFGDQGNLYLAGLLHENEEVLEDPGSSEWRIEDPAGRLAVRIDQSGNLFARGLVHPAMNDINDTAEVGGAAVTEQALLDQQPQVAASPYGFRLLNEEDGGTIVRIDVDGNIWLRGIVIQSYDGF